MSAHPTVPAFWEEDPVACGMSFGCIPRGQGNPPELAPTLTLDRSGLREEDVLAEKRHLVAEVRTNRLNLGPHRRSRGR